MCKGAILASATSTRAKGLLNLAGNLLKWNIVRKKKKYKKELPFGSWRGNAGGEERGGQGPAGEWQKKG